MPSQVRTSVLAMCQQRGCSLTNSFRVTTRLMMRTALKPIHADVHCLLRAEPIVVQDGHERKERFMKPLVLAPLLGPWTIVSVGRRGKILE